MADDLMQALERIQAFAAQAGQVATASAQHEALLIEIATVATHGRALMAELEAVRRAGQERMQAIRLTLSALAEFRRTLEACEVALEACLARVQED